MDCLLNDKERASWDALSKINNKEIYKSKELREQLSDLASKLYGKKFPVTCINCVEDAKQFIILNLNKMKKPEKKSQYTMIPGNHYFRELAMHVSNNNLTDELAQQIIDLSSKNKGYFVHAPQPTAVKEEKKIVVIPEKPKVVVITPTESKVEPKVEKTDKEIREELRQILDAKKVKYAKNAGIEKLKQLVKDNM